jgi:hypothetical protein
MSFKTEDHILVALSVVSLLVVHNLAHAYKAGNYGDIIGMAVGSLGVVNASIATITILGTYLALWVVRDGQGAEDEVMVIN